MRKATISLTEKDQEQKLHRAPQGEQKALVRLDQCLQDVQSISGYSGTAS